MAHRFTSGLFSPLKEQILVLFLRHPERAWYRSAIAREIGVTASSLQRPLAALHAAGVLTARWDGNRVYYQADVRNPVFPELRGLLAKTAGIAGVIAEALREQASRIRVAFVHGSVAAGAETPASDIDLLLVGEARLVELAPPLHAAARLLDREIQPALYSESEFRTRLRARDRFLLAVLDRPKLFVVGTEDELARLGGPAPRGAGTRRAR